jgi:hypothetical protein
MHITSSSSTLTKPAFSSFSVTSPRKALPKFGLDGQENESDHWLELHRSVHGKVQGWIDKR